MSPQGGGLIARRLQINGIVQGVGFRPFVFNRAAARGLAGRVANTAGGVEIHVEGPPGAVEAFYRDLTDRAPPLARILETAVHAAPMEGCRGFSIAPSRGSAAVTTLISPDASICEDCRRELFDPADRRFRYPFINCTNCGPRYTIISGVPYDRPRTSMRAFAMCRRCQAEYDDPADRRFHAQPNACPVCGPRVELCDGQGNRLEGEDPVREAAARLRAGGIVAVKGLGGFHLAVDGADEAAVRRLRRRKHREEKPFALMAADPAAVRAFARVAPEEELLLTGIQRPAVLLEKRGDHGLADSVAPGNRYFAVMLPYTPLHCLLLAEGFAALVMTSGNLSGEPICRANREAFRRLGGIADCFLVHDRDILQRSDDSVLRWTAGSTGFLRRSRGYVPVPVILRRTQPPVLACGAELKNTVCLTRGRQAFLGPHVGDVENAATLSFLRETAAHLERVLDVRPEIVAHDLHPDYLSTAYARERGNAERVGVQHHHAHAVSCMAEHRLAGRVIALTFDGTGYGTDGAVWGGEVLIAGEADFERAAHLSYVPMPGSAAAIREPWRMGLSYLHATFGAALSSLDLPFLAGLEDARREFVTGMIVRGVNAPPTSSLGRLFDGVAAITGLRGRVAFEGQAAMELEMASRPDGAAPYAYGWTDDWPHRIPVAPMIRGVVEDCIAGRPVGWIGGRFHATLAALFGDLCVALHRRHGLDRVVLSGGVFLNHLLLGDLRRRLTAAGLRVYAHRLVPPGDGGLALGQAVAAAAAAGN